MDLRRHRLGTAPLGIFTPLVVALALAYSASTVALPAQKPDNLEPLRRMEHRYRAAKTLQATFLERYTENDRTVRVESGVAYFRRPGKMRWEYAAPENNLFLIDGKTAWFYVPADHTVTRVPAKQSTDWRTPFALLAGETKISRVCARVVLAPDQPAINAGDAVFNCTLRGTAKYMAETLHNGVSSGPASTLANFASQQPEPDDTVLLEIARESGELVRILVRNKGGIGIEFRFAQWLDNPPIAEALFHFQPPPGVAIVNAELPSQPTNSN
jgi:outer membrane lipoprotein carrier protein